MSMLIARMRKINLGTLTIIENHNKRKFKSPLPKEIDTTLTCLNYDLVLDSSISYRKAIIGYILSLIHILLNDVSEYRTYLELKKQRFKCKSCHKTFVADSLVAEKHCFISQKVRWSVVTRLKKNTSMTEIAYQKNISVSSVYRIMKKFYRSLNPLKQSLPKTLCFDEFKSVRSVSSAMSFIMMDGDTHELLDLSLIHIF